MAPEVLGPVDQLLRELWVAWRQRDWVTVEATNKKLYAVVESNAQVPRPLMRAYLSEKDLGNKLVTLAIILRSKDPAVYDLLVREIFNAEINLEIREAALAGLQSRRPSNGTGNQSLEAKRGLLLGLFRDDNAPLRLRRMALSVLGHAYPSGDDAVYEDLVRGILGTAKDPMLRADALGIAMQWRDRRDTTEFVEWAKQMLVEGESLQGDGGASLMDAAIGYLAYSGKAGREFLLRALTERTATKPRMLIIEHLSSDFGRDTAVRKSLLHLMLDDPQDEIRIAVIQNVIKLRMQKETKEPFRQALQLLVARQEVSIASRVAAAEALVDGEFTDYSVPQEALAFLARVMNSDPRETFRNKLRAILRKHYYGGSD